MLVIVGIGVVPPAVAQQTHASRRSTRVPVTIALVNALSTGAPFQIIRRPGAGISDVILLSATGTADDLSSAVHELLLLRQLHGDTASTTGMMRVRRPQARPQAQAQRYPWTARVLQDLHIAPPKLVSGVGTVPALEIWLPPQRRRAPAR